MFQKDKGVVPGPGINQGLCRKDLVAGNGRKLHQSFRSPGFPSSEQDQVPDTEIPLGATYREHFKQVIDGLK